VWKVAINDCDTVAGEVHVKPCAHRHCTTATWRGRFRALCPAGANGYVQPTSNEAVQPNSWSDYTRGLRGSTRSTS
jgi:hypothetical protein